MEKIIWELETDRVKKSIQQGKRLDGRAMDEYRPIEIQTGISHNAEGSARIQLGKTDVIVGVKAVVGEPYPDTPGEGSISVMAEFMPIASPDFEYGPPSSESIETSRVVDRGIREAKAVNFEKLSIKNGEKVWVVFMDIYPVNHAGNLFDSSAIACLKALSESKMPKLNDKFEIVAGEFAGPVPLEHYPLMCTFSKIENTVVLDPSREEEKASSARFSVAVTEDNFLTAFQKGGGRGSFSVGEIDQCLEIASKRTKEIRKKFFS